MATTQTPSGSGQGQPSPKNEPERPQPLLDVLIGTVGLGGAVTLFATATNTYMWGCGAALLVCSGCLLVLRYRFSAPEPEPRRAWRALVAVTVVSGVAIPVLGLLPLVLPHPSFQPVRAAVAQCQPAGTVDSNPHKLPPPGLHGILSMKAFSCSVSAPQGEVPVYLGPGDTDTSGVLNANGRSWFACRLSGPGASAWYYTQGDHEGQTKYPEENAWGVIASSLPPASVVPACSKTITDALPSGSS